MSKSWIVGAALLTISLGGANAQTPAQARKDRKAAAVVSDKAAVATDKSDLKQLRERKENDKLTGNEPAVRADRKGIRKTERRLMKDRAKTGVDKVKKAL